MVVRVANVLLNQNDLAPVLTFSLFSLSGNIKTFGHISEICHDPTI